MIIPYLMLLGIPYLLISFLGLYVTARGKRKEPGRLAQTLVFELIVIGIGAYQKDLWAVVVWGASLLCLLIVTFIWWKHDNATKKAERKRREEILTAFK